MASIKQKKLPEETEQVERKNLGALLDRSREALKKYMFQMIKNNPGSGRGLFENEKTLLRMVKEGEMELDEVLPRVIDAFIAHRLKFPDTGDLIKKMDIIGRLL